MEKSRISNRRRYGASKTDRTASCSVLPPTENGSTINSLQCEKKSLRERFITIMSDAIAAARQSEKFRSLTEFRIGILVRCVELGDTKSLGTWLERIRSDSRLELSDQDMNVVVAAEYIFSSWKTVERTHGEGALLNYRHCLTHSPSKLIGLTRIENATRFQCNRPRDITDPYWALQYC